MDLLSIVLVIHSIVRWLVVVASVAALVWSALVWLGGQRNEKYDRLFMGAFTGLFDVQMLLGLILIIGLGLAGGDWPGYRFEHGLTMFVAAVVGHLSTRWRKAEAKVQARNNVILIIIVLALVFVGVARLPQGW